jgi:hypothetical protein
VPVHIVIYDLRVNNEAPVRHLHVSELAHLELLMLSDFFISVVRVRVVSGVDELWWLRVCTSGKQLPCQVNCLYGLAVMPSICYRGMRTYNMMLGVWTYANL